MICPFLEDADDRCAAHFSLNNLYDAFTHCVGRHHACPVYQRLLGERARSARQTAAISALLDLRAGQGLPVLVAG